MGLWLMIMGAVGAEMMVRPSLGSISPPEALTLPTSAAAPRLVVPSGGVPAMLLHPEADERALALQASRSARTVYGQLHNYDVRSLDVSSLDGVSVGSAWQVVREGAALRCTVTGFEHIAPIDADVGAVGAPCGAPLVQAALSCDGPADAFYAEHVAVSEGVPVSVATSGTDAHIEALDHPALAPLAQTALLRGHAQALSESGGAVEVSFYSRAISLDGVEMTVLSGVLYARGEAVALSAVVQDGAAVLVREGAITSVLDIGRDGTVEVLGWYAPDEAATSGLTWTLEDTEHTLAQDTINWCEAGC